MRTLHFPKFPFSKKLKEEPEPIAGSDEVELPSGWKSSMKGLANNDISAGWVQNEYYWNSDAHLRGKMANPSRLPSLPNWVEKHEGFKSTAWELGNNTNFRTRIMLVTYEPLKNSMWHEPPFARIMFTDENGVPFRQMSNMLRELAEDNINEVKLHGEEVERPYRLSIDGKVRDKVGCGCPDKAGVDALVDDIYLMYNSWKMFPNVDSFDLASRLDSALEAVNEMRKEESAKCIQNEISQLRDNIKSHQERISQLEKLENEIYERAADGMNLLEENGINIDEMDKNDAPHEFLGALDYDILAKRLQLDNLLEAATGHTYAPYTPYYTLEP